MDINMREKHQSVSYCTYPDWGSNSQPFGVQDSTPTNWATPAKADSHLYWSSISSPVLFTCLQAGVSNHLFGYLIDIWESVSSKQNFDFRLSSKPPSFPFIQGFKPKLLLSSMTPLSPPTSTLSTIYPGLNFRIYLKWDYFSFPPIPPFSPGPLYL